MCRYARLTFIFWFSSGLFNDSCNDDIYMIHNELVRLTTVLYICIRIVSVEMSGAFPVSVDLLTALPSAVDHTFSILIPVASLSIYILECCIVSRPVMNVSSSLAVLSDVATICPLLGCCLSVFVFDSKLQIFII